jgi:phospholipase C
MMENHSYDNYLGMLQGRGTGFTLGTDGRPEAANRDRDGEEIRAFHLSSPCSTAEFPARAGTPATASGERGRATGS